MALGVEHVYVHTINDDSVREEPVVQQLVADGHVTVMPYDVVPFTPLSGCRGSYQEVETEPQDEVLHRFSGRFRWLLMCDIDEFVVPKPAGTDFNKLLAKYDGAPPHNGTCIVQMRTRDATPGDSKFATNFPQRDMESQCQPLMMTRDMTLCDDPHESGREKIFRNRENSKRTRVRKKLYLENLQEKARALERENTATKCAIMQLEPALSAQLQLVLGMDMSSPQPTFDEATGGAAVADDDATCARGVDDAGAGGTFSGGMVTQQLQQQQQQQLQQQRLQQLQQQPLQQMQLLRQQQMVAQQMNSQQLQLQQLQQLGPAAADMQRQLAQQQQ
eukprot:g8176.t1